MPLTLPPFMKHLHQQFRNLILTVVDFFYPLFKKVMPLQTFRYAACGGFNTLLDIILFFTAYTYLFHGQSLHPLPSLFPNLIVSAHIAAFIISFSITFPVGFYFSRYVVFQETSGNKVAQLGKYIFVVFICLMLNYGFLKIFIEVFKWHALLSKLLTTLLVVSFSYISQKHFTFKTVVED
ncbi:GtrA family protein [Parasediminibacterium paludis]|uniref:GtrA family protein n=1 Tax=Parasediminibacterium paludis TaxID=908966 RepID=A0ABV8Q1E3_9BACT